MAQRIRGSRFSRTLWLSAIGVALFLSPARSEAQPDRAQDQQRIAKLEGQIGQLERAGKFAEAEEPARAVLELRSRLHGADHWQTVDARQMLETLQRVAALPAPAQSELAEAARIDQEAFQLHQQGRHAAAIPQLERALACRQRHLGKEHLLVAQNLTALGFFLDQAGKYAPAESAHRQALAIRRRALGDDHPGTSICLNNLANSLDGQGKHGDAESLYRQALAIRQRVLGDNDALTATACLNVALNLSKQGKYADAEALHRGALDIRKRVLGEDDPDTAAGYDALASCLDSQGLYAVAEPCYRLALSIFRRTLGEEHPESAITFNNLAVNLGHQGKYPEAQLLYEQALRIWRQTLGEDHVRTATGYKNLANHLDLQGQFADAEPLHRRALASRRRSLGEDHPVTTTSLNSLAHNLNLQGRHEEADPLHRQTLAIRRRILGEDHPWTATSLNNIASSLTMQGKHADAEPYYRQAVAIRRRTLGNDHPETTSSCNNLLFNQWAQRKLQEVEELGQLAARSFESARIHVGFTGLERAPFGDHSPFPILAACRARNGKVQEAWQALEANLARGLLDDMASVALPAAEAQHRQKLLGRQSQLDREMATVLGSRSAGDGQAEQAKKLRQEREQVHREYVEFQLRVATRHGLVAGQSYDLPRIQAQIPADTALLAWLDFQSTVVTDSEHWACLVRSRGQPIWVRLPGTGPQDTWTVADSELPSRVRPALGQPPAGTGDLVTDLLRQLARQRLQPIAPHLQAAADLPAVKHLVVLSAGWMSGIAVEALTDQYVISYAPSATMFAWLREKRQPGEPHGPPAEPRLLALGDPVFDRPGRSNAIVAAPPETGVMITRVLAGSNAERGQVKPGDVLLRYAGQALSSPVDLSAALRQAPPDASADTSLEVWRNGRTVALKVARGPLGIQVSNRSVADELKLRHETDALLEKSETRAYPRLAGTRREVASIARMFARADTLLGSDASVQRLAELADSDRLRPYSFIHLATHGSVDHQRPLQSALILAQDRLADPLKEPVRARKAHDGRLTAEQILSTWKLDAELVTLSACQSALGKAAGGEGYLGFAQALFIAGGRNLLLSLWPVDDSATALLMTRFYENLLGQRPGLKGPLPKAEALREAKLWLRSLTAREAEATLARLPRGELRDRTPTSEPPSARPYAHPYYWSGFILLGEGR